MLICNCIFLLKICYSSSTNKSVIRQSLRKTIVRWHDRLHLLWAHISDRIGKTIAAEVIHKFACRSEFSLLFRSYSLGLYSILFRSVIGKTNPQWGPSYAAEVTSLRVGAFCLGLLLDIHRWNCLLDVGGDQRDTTIVATA